MAILSPDDLKTLRAIDKLLNELPSYIRAYTLYLERKEVSNNSVVSYLYRYKIFFNWLCRENISAAPSIKKVPLSDLDALTVGVLNSFIDYLKNDNLDKHLNDEDAPTSTRTREKTSIALTISALKSLFIFLAKKSEIAGTQNTFISHNVMEKIDIPIKRETSHRRAEQISTQIIQGDEMSMFLNFIASDEGYYDTLDGKQKKNTFKRDQLRDLAILSLFLATGIRVGELARIQMKEINFARQTINIIRKGDKPDTVYVMPTAFKHLTDYINIRNTRYPNSVRCPFLFVSYRKPVKPLGIRAIQYLVEKYTAAHFDQGIYPHKLRHSFAVDFVKNGGDMTALRDLLGHNHLETTSLYVNMASSEKVDALQALDKKRMSYLAQQDL